MHKTVKGAALAALVLAMPGGAAAATAYATNDLNIRSGPGPQYPVVGTIAMNGAVEIEGCLENSLWCRVYDGGVSGWSYGAYLATDGSGGAVVIAESRRRTAIPTVTYERRAYESRGTVYAAREPAGTFLPAPRGPEVVTAVAPPPQIRTYVVENRRDPVYLDGELVVGVGLPGPVETYPVPDYDYHYAYVNESPVLVEPETRRVVYVYR